MMKDEKALVVLSGGQDSTICLFWACKVYKEVKAISFDYGQRHQIELESAKKIAELAGVEHTILDAKFINTLTENALTRPDIVVEVKEGELPSTFVDGRNMFFLTMAAVVAKRQGITNLVTGVSAQDFSDYPDCRPEFIKSLETTLRLAMEYHFKIETPLMNITKANSILYAEEYLGPDCMTALGYSHTCYEGQFPPCGECPACKLRIRGFFAAGIPDPIYARTGVEHPLA